MLVIRRNQNNKMVVSVSSHKTLSNPNYLFSFEHILSKEKVRFFPKNISTSTNRYDEFEFNEGVKPVGYTGDAPYEIFPYPGQYYYSIYECFTNTNTNPAYAFDKLEEGRAFVEDDSVPDPYSYTYVSSNEENSNYIYYTPGTNEERLQVALVYQADNGSQSYFNWKYAYPDLLIEDLETGVIERVSNTLYDEDDYACNNFTKVSGETFHKEITTGSTWGGFKVYLDPLQVIQYGYENAEIGKTPYSVITAYTFTNLGVNSSIPIAYSATTTRTYADGHTDEGPGFYAFNVDNDPPRVFIFGLTGNTEASFSYGNNFFTGTTFEEACSRVYASDYDHRRRLYYTYSNSSQYWWNDTGTTSSYSLTKCDQTINNTDFFVATQILSGLVYVASATSTGDIVFYDTCIPPTPTPSPTPSITPTITPTPNPACPQQIVISDTTNGSIIPNGSYNELTFAGTEYGYFSGGSFFTGTAPDGNNYKVFGIQPSSTYYTYCWDVVNEDWGVGRSNYAYLGQGGTYTGGAWLGASTSVVFGSEYLPGTGSKGLFTTYYLSYPVLCPTPSITPTITPTSTITPTQSATPTPTPTLTPSPTPITYNILAENTDELLTEGGNNLIKEQLT